MMPGPDPNPYITTALQASHHMVARMLADPQLVQTLQAAADRCVHAVQNGHTIFLAGNGGSAAQAQHMAGELVGRFTQERRGLPAMALTADSVILTAISNDYGYPQVFRRQIVAWGRPGDVLMAYSTSGHSPNILEALAAAREQGLLCIGWTGQTGGAMEAWCDHLLCAPSSHIPQIQEAHLILGHIWCGLIERALFPAGAA